MTDENGGIFMPKKYNTIIIGGGTAGLTAAIYTARQIRVSRFLKAEYSAVR